MCGKAALVECFRFPLFFMDEQTPPRSGFKQFLLVHKKWWLTPIVILVLAFGLLLMFAKTSSFSPFIYSLF